MWNNNFGEGYLLMIKNKKGSMFMSIIMAIMLFMIGMIVVNFIKTPIDDARASLNCDNAAAITDGTKLVCLTMDISLVYWIILVVSIAGGAILDKVLL